MEDTGSESTVIRIEKHQKRLEKFRKTFPCGFGTKRPWVQVPQPGPNKHDSFDTKVSETNGGYGITLYDEVHVHE